VLSSEFLEMIDLQQKGVASLHGDGGDAGGRGRFEGAGADDGNVEAHVLARLGDLDDDSLPLPEFPAAADGGVGPVESLDGKDGPLLHDHGLTDVESAHFLRNAMAESDVVEQARFRLGPRDKTFACKMPLQKGGREQEGDAGFFKFVGDRSKERLGIALPELCQQEEGMEVGAEVEEIPRGDLARHHRGSGPALLGGIDESAELADAHPLDLIHESGKRGIGLSLESGCNHFGNAGFSGALRRKAGIGAVTGDQKECLWLLHDPRGYP